MEFLKAVYSKETSDNYQIIDIFNKKKYLLNKSEKLFYESQFKSPFHLAEIPLFPSPIIIDVDIKQKGKPKELLYDDFTIKEIVLSYVKILDDFLSVKPTEYKILLLEKPPKYNDNTGITKNGFHLQFVSLALNKQDLNFIYEKVLEISEFSDFLDNVSSKPWLLYGATKTPEDIPYKITKGIIVKNENLKFTDYTTFFTGPKFLNTNNLSLDKLLVSYLSIRNLSIQDQYTIDYNKIPRERNIINVNDIHIQEESKEKIYISALKIVELVLLLNDSRSEIYEDWIRICMILTSIAKKRSEEDQNTLESGFHTFSQKSSLYNEIECQQKWNYFFLNSRDKIRSLGIGSLIYYVKQDVPDFNLKSILCNYSLDFIPIHDYDIAEHVKNSITDLYMTNNIHGCYKYDETYWRELPSWENILKDHISNWFKDFEKKIKQQILEQEDTMDEERLKKIKSSLNSLTRKVMNFSSRNNLSKSLFDLLHNSNFDNLFTQKTNVVAFKNLVFDINKWKMVEGSPTFFISKRIEHDYIPWEEVPEKNKKIVLDFWSKIFPDEQLRKYCIELLARPISCQNALKQFPFWTGSGNNGKSVCVKLLENIFGKMVMKIPKSLITGSQSKVGGLNPELCRLKNSMFAFIDEITLNDVLDPGQIKNLTGNDALFVRDLFQKSKDITEILPYFLPNIITNNIPIIKRPDEATWNRIRLINFESVFTRNVDEYLKKYPSTDPNKVFRADPNIYNIIKDDAKYFLSYFMHILLSYKSFNEFNLYEELPSKVIEGCTRFKEGQNAMKQFLDENFIVDANSTEIFTLQKLMKEYNASRPIFTLDIQEVLTSLQDYSRRKPIITIFDDKVKGLSRGD